ncbi:carboxymuconolactone decarboxylase family protein [Streptomyces coelicoflavus]|uniref:Carboxymuconolactone decarboxylase family protein n=1 Tax=Streptomyces coelicoflavus TaxID=285562 RepID=A0A7K3PE34_9ACTN|nr:carboxymuconolactone decarboxylase family protein [Streptomyces coelicoflavus]NEB08142.1 carboxymuconolactone decarboxylase family protein [Streptomyces coelicoflavus]
MQPRMENPAIVIPEASEPIQELYRASKLGGVPQTTLALVHLRCSQINGDSFCVSGDAQRAKEAGLSEEKLLAVGAWRDAPFYTEAERVALALAEAGTRLADRSEPLPDELWQEATKHYGEKELASVLLTIAVTNLFSRLNVTTRQPAGSREWDR